ncbi:hypothetical protein [Actinorugispora endophytica]|uniref:DNA primase n=1 Tax=Actinorugispora endophytica TaxID=1605990 RepID=A0A4R6UVV2_9ACTN|nr:hypothetical protein [Actinorugispora endophytica]TDQ49595.1 hypothetical protein EV190_11545 [Actinorugispora endophytica]
MTTRTPELTASLRRLAAGTAIVLLALVPLSACDDSAEAPREDTESESMTEDGEDGEDGENDMEDDSDDGDMGGEEEPVDGDGAEDDMGGEEHEDH